MVRPRTHPVCDALEEAGAVAEPLGGEADPLPGGVTGEAHHVLLQTTSTPGSGRS